MSNQENFMSRHQLEVATKDSELGFFFGFPPEAFRGFGPDSFYSINKELSNSKVVFLLLHYRAKGKEEELNVYFREDFYFFIFLV